MTLNHEQKHIVPVACTLPPTAAVSQSLEWADLREVATSVEAVPAGARLTFPLALLATIEDLVARETSCCSFLTFMITKSSSEIVLEVTAVGDDAQQAITSFAGFDI